MKFRKIIFLISILISSVFIFSSCEGKSETLKESREGYKTKLTKLIRDDYETPKPPEKTMKLIKYTSEVGKLDAYLTANPQKKEKHPAIIWLGGGFSNSIDEGYFQKGPESNDQSAYYFREKGIVTMYPSLRGGNGNEYPKEGFYGEVNDVIAAYKYLKNVDYVDPDRIYLGGHSTGGTLALLVSEYGEADFRAVFSFGPVHSVTVYDSEEIPFDIKDSKEMELRATMLYLGTIQTPTFIIEGEKGNSEVLTIFSTIKRSDKVSLIKVKGKDHFSVLSPSYKVVADKILLDIDPVCNIKINTDEIK